MRQNKPQHFDLLAIDAFAGDAIPVHLLTEEAFAIYSEQLNQPSGILALHVTNGYFDLRPVIFMMAERFGMRSYWIHSKGDTTVDGGNDWILLSRDCRFLDSFSRVNAGLSPYTPAALARPRCLETVGSGLRSLHPPQAGCLPGAPPPPAGAPVGGGLCPLAEPGAGNRGVRAALQ